MANSHRDYTTVLRAVESGDASAKVELAWYKLSGLGGAKKDEEGAVSLLEERVKEGDPDAAWMLGLCCEYGIGINQDLERLELLYQQSSDSGNAVGDFLMWNFSSGRGKGIVKRTFGL